MKNENYHFSVPKTDISSVFVNAPNVVRLVFPYGKSRLGRALKKCGNYLISELKTNRCLFSCFADFVLKNMPFHHPLNQISRNPRYP